MPVVLLILQTIRKLIILGNKNTIFFNFRNYRNYQNLSKIDISIAANRIPRFIQNN